MPKKNGWKQRLTSDPLMMAAQRAIRGSAMNYEQLARVSGLCSSTISKIDNSRTRLPQSMTIYCILRACGVRLGNS